MAKTPDFIEPFTGWKGLLADDAGNLRSPLQTLWPPHEPLLARCLNYGRTKKDHQPPVKGCTCGIYAVKTFEDLKSHGYNWGRMHDDATWVVAEVKLWGQVRTGQIGYRASHAYPAKIYVPVTSLPLGKLVSERYGVPLGVIDRFSGRRT